jgi:hypothetical protein
MASFNGPLSCPHNLGLQLFGLLAILAADPAATAVPAADPLSSGRFWRSFCGADRDPYSSRGPPVQRSLTADTAGPVGAVDPRPAGPQSADKNTHKSTVYTRIQHVQEYSMYVTSRWRRLRASLTRACRSVAVSRATLRVL